ncbi:MAG: hypothetical protein ACI9TF_001915 [Paracrocinitomix sp.]|jgi:hypothetical protein
MVRQGGKLLHPLQVLLDTLALAEGHDGNLDVCAKFIQPITNRNHVLCTWQSIHVAVKDENDVFAAMVIKSPDVACGVEQDHFRGGSANMRAPRGLVLHQ